jgi:galactokinase/mevalonate kinase-like predicted kinase
MTRVLLSVPPHLRDFIHSPAGRRLWRGRLAELAGGADVFVGADPRSRRLGSGGGTIALLVQAWSDGLRRHRKSLFEWLEGGQTLVLHGGGESRRLPVYAALGKVFLPMPAVDGLAPRRFDQMLADFQIPAYQQVLQEAGKKAAVLVTAGDVWLDFDPLQIPAATADITGIGMRVPPEVARNFGVYFVARDQGAAEGSKHPIAFFLQKPAAEEIHRLSARYDFFVDTGMWLLSISALRLLFRRCGWDDKRGCFATPDGHPGHLDLYTEIGSALGSETRAPARLRRLGWSALREAVIPLEEARFYHLGSSRQIFESFEHIQRGKLSPRRTLCVATPPSAFTNSSSLPVWLDAVAAENALRLDGHNIVSGLPAKARIRWLGQGWCVEAAPVGRDEWVLRAHHLDDTLGGAVGAGGRICGRGALEWLAARGLPQPKREVFELPIYPVLPATEIDQDALSWFFDPHPDPAVGARLARHRRLSAAQIPEAVNFARCFADRSAAHAGCLRAEFEACAAGADMRVFTHDFAAISLYARRDAPALGRWLRKQGPQILTTINKPEHASRLLLLLAGLEKGRKRSAFLSSSYTRLQESVIASNSLGMSRPRLALKDDQIVWARSPLRLDLAGGWTDTPPYCFEFGGCVLNVAVLLNGQPPIQAFVRPIPHLKFRLRSIDLGSMEDIESFADLASFRSAHLSFSLPKAALALAGFLPGFIPGRPPGTLRELLRRFGGGLEISLLSAVPKGSGLGTSSILGATLLGALNRACGLGWDHVDLYHRVLSIEQLLTTGGGWQDQAGALFGGVKLIETEPGLAQTPCVRYLPENLLGDEYANQTLLLYYTGVTRLAKGILKEIVHDMFLARSSTLRTLGLIRANAQHLHRALQEGDQASLHRCIARSWDLNRRLDPGTTTRQIERVIRSAGVDLAACKLLGAGGGGYMLLCADSPEAGRRIRARLEEHPLNARARFIDFRVSSRPVEVTVS